MTDPLGPVSGVLRVVRGSFWHNDAQYCRSAYRGGTSPWAPNLDFFQDCGFRIACHITMA
jgi:formylglycine-generating enzyme required for sulfatase activity